MKNIKGKIFVGIMLLLLQIWCAKVVQADLVPASYEIRVGLVSLYSGKETLTIQNTKLGYGYCLNNTYLQEAILESTTGFSFTPVNGYFVADTTNYGSYQAAVQAAESYQQLGIEAWPGSRY